MRPYKISYYVPLMYIKNQLKLMVMYESMYEHYALANNIMKERFRKQTTSTQAHSNNST